VPLVKNLTSSFALVIPNSCNGIACVSVQSKSVPKIAVFQKFEGLNIKYTYRDPKRHFLTRNDVFWCNVRTTPFRGVGCSLIEEPKKTKKTSHPKSTAKSRILGNRNRWTNRYKILHVECRPWHNHACQFLEDRLMGFGVARGRILAFSIDLFRRL